MKKIKKVKKNKLSKSEKINMFLFSLICILTLSFTVGYSVLNQELNISGEAHFRPQEDLRITNIHIKEAVNGATSNYENYSKKSIMTGVELPYSNSSISYEITFTNFGTSEMMISNIIETSNNYNMFYSLQEVKIDENGSEILVPINNVEGMIFKSGEQKKIIIIFQYHTYDGINTSLAGMLEFEFISNVKSKLAMGSSDVASFFNGNVSKEKIESIEIVPTMSIPTNVEVLGSWDASLDNDRSVVAWYTDLDGDELYELTLGCNKTLIAPEDCTMLFYGFSNMSTLNLNGILNTSLVTKMNYMFMGNSKLTTLKLDGLFTTPLVDDMTYMFANNSSLSNLELTTVTTELVKGMSGMFGGCSNLETLDLSKFETINVTSMASMFNNCSKLTNLDLSNFNTSNVTSMASMFSSCTGLTNLDLSNFDTSIVKSASSMFNGCKNLYSLVMPVDGNGSEGFNFNSLTSVNYMFQNCSKLTNIIFKNFNTAGCSQIRYVFSGCNNLSNLVISGFDITGVSRSTYYSNVFDNCTSLINLDISNGNFYNANSAKFKVPTTVQNLNMSNLDFSTNKPFDLQNLSNLKTVNLTGFKIPKEMASFFSGCTSLISVDFSNSVLQQLATANNMFYNCNSLTSIIFDNTFPNKIMFDTKYVKSLSFMFYGCSNLKYLDLSGMNTSGATEMDWLIHSCTLLEWVNLSNFDTSNVTSMAYMFSNCSSLKYIISNYIIPDISTFTPSTSDNKILFNTSSLTNMVDMFSGCSSLEKLDLSAFDVSKVTNTIINVFDGCNKLTNLDLSGLLFNVTANTGTIILPKSLEKLNLSDANLVNKWTAFSGLPNLKTINLSGAQLNSNADNMFFDLPNLETLDLSNTIFKDEGDVGTNLITNSTGMFSGNINLKSVNFGNINISSELSNMFYNCTSLKQIEFGTIEYNSNHTDMFYNVPIDSEDFVIYVKDNNSLAAMKSILGINYYSKVQLISS